ncbi:hypothetical protein [Cellulomonas sp. 73-145]|uniref:hypothetical protein n=1 Tax=Cellulomonas sp. 73-145 TaxID=1895739 RepID=UPI001AD14044|nr:hypothetical protein [Cellulomonas sp. 73-145]MBN9327918.1 hypothetical protein [Cellulomonas sp.]
MAHLLKLSRSTVRHRTQRGLLLAAPLRSGALIYPLFQLDGEQVLPAFGAAAAPFRAHHVDAWATLDWFTTPSKVLHGRTPATAIREQSSELRAVIALACDTARRWSRLDLVVTPSHPAGSDVGDRPKAHRSPHRDATADDPHLHPWQRSGHPWLTTAFPS